VLPNGEIYIIPKKSLKNKAMPEACMASNYMYDKALGFCTEYFALYLHTRDHMWDLNEEEVDIGEVLEGHAQFKKLNAMELEAIHEHVIMNFVATNALYMYTFQIATCWWVCNGIYVHKIILEMT
jgi:hypothetical protein